MPNNSLIKKAWALRVNRDLEGFFEVFMFLQRRLAVVDFENAPADIFISGDVDFEEWAQICLMQISFLRTQNQFTRANTIFANIEKVAHALHRPIPHRYFMEKGLNYLVQSDYFLALENFMKAQDDPSIDLQARINVLICLEYLNLSLDKAAAGFAKQLSKYKDFRPIQGLVNQWEAFELRQAFRKGKFAQIEKSKPAFASQGIYYRAWALCLPYHDSKDDESYVDRFVSKKTKLLFSSYRIRTLAGLSHPDDNTVSLLSERVERIYLWTWRWLANPEGFSLTKIAGQIEDLKNEVSPHRMGFQDILMLRNTLGWIGLFDSANELQFSQFLSQFNFNKDRSTEWLLELEHLLICYFKASRDGNAILAEDILATMKTVPLWDDPHLLFRHLVTSNKGGRSGSHFETLRKNLSLLIESRKQKNNADFVVDLDHFEFSSKKHNFKIVSEPVVRALWLLHSKSNVRPEEFMSFVFSIAPYDLSAHDAKINNLLSRIRRALPPELKITFREGRIAALGPWSNFQFLGQFSLHNQFKNQVHFKLTAVKPMGFVKKDPLLAELATFGRHPFSRRDLENKIKKSRATINRLLDRLVRQGILRAEGKARATRYIFESEVTI